MSPSPQFFLINKKMTPFFFFLPAPVVWHDEFLSQGRYLCIMHRLNECCNSLCFSDLCFTHCASDLTFLSIYQKMMNARGLKDKRKISIYFQEQVKQAHLQMNDSVLVW